MRKLIFFTFFIFPIYLNAQKIPVITFDHLEELYSRNNDTVYLVNYWATWCKPCIEELPDFLKLSEELKNKKFSLILVSLDFQKDMESRVIPFIEKNTITDRVVILDDDANVWINKVNSNWDGSIPVSQVIVNGHKLFYNHILSYLELKNIIEPKLK